MDFLLVQFDFTMSQNKIDDKEEYETYENTKIYGNEETETKNREN